MHIEHLAHGRASLEGFLSGSVVKNPPTIRRHMSRWFEHWVGKIPWRRAWQCTPVFLPGESHRQRGLAGYGPWGHEESDVTEATEQACMHRASWWLSGKESACQCRRHRFDPWVGKSPGEGNGHPLQYSCLENPMDRGAWEAMVHGVTKSRTQLKQLSKQACVCVSQYIGWDNSVYITIYTME